MAKRENTRGQAEPADSFRTRLVDYLFDERRLPSIGREISYGLADIRQKLVEEATYGRAVTPPIDVGIHGRDADGENRDPLGRSQGPDPFRERCQEVFARSQPDDRGRDGPEPER